MVSKLSVTSTPLKADASAARPRVAESGRRSTGSAPVVRDLERAAARQILDELDNLFPPSMERRRLREMVLDTLALMREQIEQCYGSALPAETTGSPS